MLQSNTSLKGAERKLATRRSVRVVGLVLAVAIAAGSTAHGVPTLVEPDAAQAQHLRT